MLDKVWERIKNKANKTFWLEDNGNSETYSVIMGHSHYVQVASGMYAPTSKRSVARATNVNLWRHTIKTYEEHSERISLMP